MKTELLAKALCREFYRGWEECADDLAYPTKGDVDERQRYLDEMEEKYFAEFLDTAKRLNK